MIKTRVASWTSCQSCLCYVVPELPLLRRAKWANLSCYRNYWNKILRSDPYLDHRSPFFSVLKKFLGVYLHSLVLTAFHNGSGITKMKYFAPFGWLMPLVITIIWIVANHKYRDKESICWDSNLSKFILIECYVTTNKPLRNKLYYIMLI